jgi:NitT/TauT family transport system substrate-binding protein
MRKMLSAFALLITLCNGTPAAAQNTNVRFVLDFLLQGQQSAFVLGRERGYYAAQGINFSAFDPGRGGADSISKVATGTHDRLRRSQLDDRIQRQEPRTGTDRCPFGL